MRSAVFFERDGILNLVRVEREHQVIPLTMEAFELNPQAEEPLDRLKEAGFLLFATTNQPGLSQGRQSRTDLDLMHEVMSRRFKLDGVLLCPHDESDHCPCRKPKAGLIAEAAFQWHLDLDRSFVVSDKWQDAQSAHVAGCTSVLIRSPWNGRNHHDVIVDDLASAAEKIIQLHTAGGRKWRVVPRARI